MLPPVCLGNEGRMSFYVAGHILFLHILQLSIYMVSCPGIWRAFVKTDLYCSFPFVV